MNGDDGTNQPNIYILSKKVWIRKYNSKALKPAMHYNWVSSISSNIINTHLFDKSKFCMILSVQWNCDVLLIDELL